MNIYLVCSKDGKYLQSLGYKEATWTKKIDKAKHYTHIGRAKSLITTFHNQYPSLPIPNLVSCDVVVNNIIDLSESVREKRKSNLNDIVKICNELYTQYHAEIVRPATYDSDPIYWSRKMKNEWECGRHNQNLEVGRRFNNWIYEIRNDYGDFDINGIGLISVSLF